MLSKRLQELLSASVDGELTSRERESVDDLLRKSNEARQLFDQLKRDAQKLRSVRKVRLSSDYPSIILKHVADKRPTPARSQNPIARWMPVWANMVAAAAVILAVCGATTLVVVWNEQQKKAELAQKDKGLYEKAATPQLIENPVVVKIPKNADDTPQVEKVPSMPVELAMDTRPKSPIKPENQSTAPAASPSNLPTPPLTKVGAPKLPSILAIKDLDQPAVREKLIESLKNETLVQIDLFCKDPIRAAEKMQAAFKGQKVLVDGVAQECLKLKVAKMQFLCYTENLTADEIDRILQLLAAEERKTDAKQFDKAVVKPLVAAQLKPILGVEPKWLQGRSGASVRPYENIVLVLATGKVVSNPTTSKEVKQFVETRRDRKPGTVAVLISIRESD